MQSRSPRDLQLRVSNISVRVQWFIPVSFQLFVLVSFHFLLVLCPFNLFSLDYGSAEEACENFARPIENNRGSREESWAETRGHCKTTRVVRYHIKLYTRQEERDPRTNTEM